MRIVFVLPFVILAGCVPEEIDPVQPLPVDDTCKSSQFQEALGQPAADYDFDSAGRPVRILPPNSIVTQEYLPARLNVDLDGAGRVVRMWCG